VTGGPGWDTGRRLDGAGRGGTRWLEGAMWRLEGTGWGDGRWLKASDNGQVMARGPRRQRLATVTATGGGGGGGYRKRHQLAASKGGGGGGGYWIRLPNVKWQRGEERKGNMWF
jgi:hypothetical protein